jgi:hypothetical protein
MVTFTFIAAAVAARMKGGYAQSSEPFVTMIVIVREFAGAPLPAGSDIAVSAIIYASCDRDGECIIYRKLDMMDISWSRQIVASRGKRRLHASVSTLAWVDPRCGPPVGPNRLWLTRAAFARVL